MDLRQLANEFRARVSTNWRVAWPDVALGLVLALAGFIVTLISYERLTPAIYHLSTWDFWFESDPNRIYNLAIDRWAPHHHSTSHHPLFSLLMYPPVFVLTGLFKLSAHAAIGAVLAGGTALWLITANYTLRTLGLARLDAFVFTVLMSVSAAAVFWFPTPETFGLGALSIMIVMAVCAYSERNNGAPKWLYLFASTAAISVTTTNWLAGLAMLIVFFHWRAAATLAAVTLILVNLLWAVQLAVFPAAETFLNVFRSSEIDYLFNPESLGIVPKLIVFFFHSIVLPDITTAYGYRLTVQGAMPGAGGPLAIAGVSVWAALFALGIWSVVRLWRKQGLLGAKTVAVLALAIAGQLLITILFGIESFLYSPHFAPLLVTLTALSALTPARHVAVALAFVLAVVAGINNFQKLEEAAVQVEQRLEHERRFAAALASLTDADGLLVCGMAALAGSGEIRMKRESPATVGVRDLYSPANPDTCAHVFDESIVLRRGWRLWYEDWSLDAIDTFAQRGARYFVTQYEYGLRESRGLFDELDARYTTVARDSEWAIYDLQISRDSHRR